MEESMKREERIGYILMSELYRSPIEDQKAHAELLAVAKEMVQ